MAGLWQRFTLIFKSKASRALDRAENPTETLDYSYEQMLQQLQNVKRGVGRGMEDTGAAIQRARDKTDELQARASAIEELTAAGTLEDIGDNRTQLDRELAQISSSSQVDDELAKLKAEVGPGDQQKEIEEGSAPPPASS